MTKRIGIDMGLDASGVAKGAKDAERALEKLEDAVGDTGKGGAKDLEQLEDGLRLSLPLLTASRRDTSPDEHREERRQPQAR